MCLGTTLFASSHYDGTKLASWMYLTDELDFGILCKFKNGCLEVRNKDEAVSLDVKIL